MEVRSWSAADEDVVGHSSYCVVGSTLLRFGGFNGQAEVNTTAMRNEDGTWQQLATTGDLPSPRARAAAVSVDDTTMLVWGGAIYVEGAPSSRYGPNTCADAGALHILDVPARRWRTVAPADWVPPPRQGHTATNIGGGDIIIEAKETISMKCKDFKLEASNSINVSSGMSTSIATGTTCSVDGGAMLTLRSAFTKIN